MNTAPNYDDLLRSIIIAGLKAKFPLKWPEESFDRFYEEVKQYFAMTAKETDNNQTGTPNETATTAIARH